MNDIWLHRFSSIFRNSGLAEGEITELGSGQGTIQQGISIRRRLLYFASPEQLVR